MATTTRRKAKGKSKAQGAQHARSIKFKLRDCDGESHAYHVTPHGAREALQLAPDVALVFGKGLGRLIEAFKPGATTPAENDDDTDERSLADLDVGDDEYGDEPDDGADDFGDEPDGGIEFGDDEFGNVRDLNTDGADSRIGDVDE